MSTIITSVDRHSPAERAGITPGEQLLTINGHQIIDVLDYRFYGYDTDCCLELREPAGTVRTVSLRKPEGRDLGLNFDTVLMDDMRSCANHCIFCFVDQMPPGMRKTLYFKDDDARLSFLQGNYITLTNLTDREAQRIIDLRISPINVSVHTTDPQLHCTMLGNKNALRSLDYIRALCKAGIVMNGQIVVCPGWNDGDQLRRTLRDLTEMQFSSCSLVPVGITKYRQGLAKLRPVDAATAAEIIDIADEYGRENLERFGTRRFFCADELYLRQAVPCPGQSITRATVSWKTAWASCALWRMISWRAFPLWTCPFASPPSPSPPARRRLRFSGAWCSGPRRTIPGCGGRSSPWKTTSSATPSTWRACLPGRISPPSCGGGTWGIGC